MIGGRTDLPGCEGEIKWNGKIIALQIEPVNLSAFSLSSSRWEFVAPEQRQKEKEKEKKLEGQKKSKAFSFTPILYFPGP